MVVEMPTIMKEVRKKEGDIQEQAARVPVVVVVLLTSMHDMAIRRRRGEGTFTQLHCQEKFCVPNSRTGGEANPKPPQFRFFAWKQGNPVANEVRCVQSQAAG